MFIRLFALIGVLAAGLLRPDGDIYITLLAALSIACFDGAAVICARNVVVVYYFLVLGVGPYLIDLSDPIGVHRFAVLLFATFLAGILARRALRGAQQVDSDPPPASMAAPGVGRRASILLKTAIVIQFALIGANIAQYGAVAFFSGASLAGNISSYVQDGGLTNYQILAIAGFTVTAALVGVYVQINEPERLYDWRLLIVLLVGVPLVGLERANVLKDVLVLLFVYRWAFHGKRKRIVSQTVVISVLLVVALAAGLGIGVLRSGLLSPDRAGSNQVQSVLLGELTPVAAIDDALAPGAPRYGGAGLFIPLVQRFAPRRLYPDKAQNTTMRYMLWKDPESYAAGFSLAITGVGAVVFNYGAFGAYLLALAIGFVVGGGRPPTSSRVGYSIVGFFMLYDLMRTDPVFSVSQALVALLGYRILLGVYRWHSSPSDSLRRPLVRSSRTS